MRRWSYDERLLRGTYYGQIEGTIVSAPQGQPTGPVGAIGTITFDGDGFLTIADMASLMGNFFPRTGKGTYTVNSLDYTGTATITFDSAPFEGLTQHLSMVLSGNGDRFLVISTDPGGVVMGSFNIQF
jgi:hypothetical protein